MCASSWPSASSVEERHVLWCRTFPGAFLALLPSHPGRAVDDDGCGEIEPPPKCSQLTLAIQ